DLTKAKIMPYKTSRLHKTSIPTTLHLSPPPAEDVLIIYESEAEQWAWYLHSLLLGSIPEAGMCCYDIATVTSRQDDFLHLSGYKCKLLILSRGLLDGLCQERRFFLSRVLQPEGRVVVLLCGVENLEPLLELVPLRGEECLQISSEQDAQEYCVAVAEIVHRGELTSAADVRRAQEPAPDRERWDGGLRAKTTFLLLPYRVPCENPGQVFLLLREVVASENPEVEFNGSKQSVRAEAAKWNESTLCVPAPDFPAGSVGVTLYCGGVVLGKARLHYYSTMGEISRLLQQAADPVNFMCQALQVSSTEQVDHMLASCLMQKMPTGGFQGLQSDQIHAGDTRTEDIPTLLHFAAEHGLRDLASVLLQCPGAPQALRTADRLGHTPLALAHARGHSHLHVLLQESLVSASVATLGEVFSFHGYDPWEKAHTVRMADLEQISDLNTVAVANNSPHKLCLYSYQGALSPRFLSPPGGPRDPPNIVTTATLLHCAENVLSRKGSGLLEECRSGEGCNDDTSVYELMGRAGNLQVTDSHKELQPAALGDHGEQGEEEEDPYAHFGVTCEKNDTVLTAYSCVAIANRPPAPTPRPETFPTKKKSMPFIAQVFQKKMSQADSETLYSLPSKQTRVRDSISSTYDTFVPSQPPGLDELIRLQEQVKGGSLSVDEALERFSDWQRLQRGTDTAQQDKLRQLRADIVSSKVDNDNVYDKISIVHHTPGVTSSSRSSAAGVSNKENGLPTGVLSTWGAQDNGIRDPPQERTEGTAGPPPVRQRDFKLRALAQGDQDVGTHWLYVVFSPDWLSYSPADTGSSDKGSPAPSHPAIKASQAYLCLAMPCWYPPRPPCMPSEACSPKGEVASAERARARGTPRPLPTPHPSDQGPNEAPGVRLRPSVRGPEPQGRSFRSGLASPFGAGAFVQPRPGEAEPPHGRGDALMPPQADVMGTIGNSHLLPRSTLHAPLLLFPAAMHRFRLGLWCSAGERSAQGRLRWLSRFERCPALSSAVSERDSSAAQNHSVMD
ncbi:hypothetical protein P4O66_008387, partial [Electrophorus voltai]